MVQVMRLTIHVVFEWEVMNEWKRRHIKRILVFLVDIPTAYPIQHRNRGVCLPGASYASEQTSSA